MRNQPDELEDVEDADKYLDALDLWTPTARARATQKRKRKRTQPTHSAMVADLIERANLERPAPGATIHDPKPKPNREETFHSLAEENRAMSSFNPTFAGLSSSTKNHVSKHEREWIFTYLGGFYEEHLITDVLRRVKSGKEATVYCCAADPRTGTELLAGKVYHERMFRSLKNDALYREGRELLDDEGKEMRGRRIRVAMAKKTGFGQQLRHMTWLTNEYKAMTRLHAVGADVPKPFIHSENAILMEYVGDREGPAPALVNVRLPQEEAQPLFERLLWNIEVMFENNLVHGDLSAHNILYWEGKATIIDFPQVVVPFVNPHAYALLVRDVKRVCEYFARYGIETDAEDITKDLWDKYVPS